MSQLKTDPTSEEICPCCGLIKPVLSGFQSEKQHTPTPWVIDPGKVGNTDIVYRNPYDENNGLGISIHSGIDEDGRPIATEQDRLDAEFIVRAVNAYESLLKENIELRIEKEKLVEAAKKILSFKGLLQQNPSEDTAFQMAIAYLVGVISSMAEGSH